MALFVIMEQFSRIHLRVQKDAVKSLNEPLTASLMHIIPAAAAVPGNVCMAKCVPVLLSLLVMPWNGVRPH